MLRSLKNWARRTAGKLHDWRISRVRVRERSTLVNAYHCCVQKTASQWIRGILSDPRAYRHSGLKAYNYQQRAAEGYDGRRLTERTFDRPFPPGTIVTPLYLDYDSYRSIPKPAPYRTFFVARDPRDILVSWYFSVKHSHGAMGDVIRNRQALQTLSLADGLVYMLDYMESFGVFRAMSSWLDAPRQDDRVLLFRFEDLTGSDRKPHFEALFRHLGIPIPVEEMGALLADHSFERLSGRSTGSEDRRSHYRKGVAGDWKNHFDDRVRARVNEIAGKLVERWGYGGSQPGPSSGIR